MCSCRGHNRKKCPEALIKEWKRRSAVTELEQNMDWPDTGLAQALKASTSTPGRRP